MKPKGGEKGSLAYGMVMKNLGYIPLMPKLDLAAMLVERTRASKGLT